MRRLLFVRARAGFGFTLIELLIVVVIMGILAAAVLPLIGNAREQAQQQVFANHLRNLVSMSRMYFDTHAALPPQGAGDPIPPVIFEAARRRDEFPSRPPIGGGYWHLGRFVDVNRWGVGVWWPGEEKAIEDAIMHIDEEIDDGDPNAGVFQIRDRARYYWFIN